MSKLAQDFEKALDNIGLNNKELLNPVFYNSPVSIRFEIGVSDENLSDWQNTEYINRAFIRAKKIYENLPAKPTILRIDSYDEQTKALESAFAKLKLPLDYQKVDSEFADECDIIHKSSFYWDLELFELDFELLLKEVIKSELGGMYFLASSVFFADTKNDVLFHLYDDRGADVSAHDANTIRPMYEKLNGYILDYDRERIDEIFKA